MRFMDILVRQEHPGERRGPYRTYEQKMEAAREYEREEEIPWPVLVDDLAGTVHGSYGGNASPVYLIDAAGWVVFYGVLPHAPTLKRAIDELLSGNGQGAAVAGGLDRAPLVLASLVDGWRGPRRGGVRALLDLELAVPGAASLSFLGHLFKPLLAPLALRASPLSAPAKLALVGGLAGTVVLGLWSARRRGYFVRPSGDHVKEGWGFRLKGGGGV